MRRLRGLGMLVASRSAIVMALAGVAFACTEEELDPAPSRSRDAGGNGDATVVTNEPSGKTGEAADGGLQDGQTQGVKDASSTDGPPPFVGDAGPDPTLDPGTAPAWFLGATTGAWTTVAGATGSRIADCLPNPIPHVPSSPDQPSCITTAWTGGAVDQARGEYLLAGNGGHADYPGNEGYAISMRAETPKWRRIADPTPNESFGYVFTEGNGLYADGRPRSMHSTFQCFGDGRIWYPLQNSVTSGAGGSVNGVVSFNRDVLGAASSPLPWSASNTGPWELHGPPFPVGTYIGGAVFGVCAFDRVTHKVWALAGNSANSTVYWSVDTTGPTMGQAKTYQANQSFGNWGGWLALADDLRILVAGDHLRQVITVLDLTNPGAPGAWKQISNVTGTGFFEQGSGGVYVRQNHTIAIGNPRSQGGKIRRLAIPTKVVGGKTVYDPAGSFAWTTLAPGGATLTAPIGNSDTYTKWNIIEDMGNGQSAIVVVTDITGPVYVYKIPAGGL